MQNQNYNQPLVSIDVVPVRFNGELGKLEFATAERLFEPFKGQQALPGVLLSGGELIEEAAARALETKADLPRGTFLNLGAFDSTNRDPRGATISIALISAQHFTDDSSKAVWQAEAGELPFDHTNIIGAAFARVREALWSNEALTRALLGERFTTADALASGLSVGHPSNAGRWLAAWGPLTRSPEKTKTGEAGRPSVTWEWSEPADEV